jgi:hypothetical protein
MSAVLILILTQAACILPVTEAAAQPVDTEASATLLAPKVTFIPASSKVPVSDQSTPGASPLITPTATTTLISISTPASSLGNATQTATPDALFSKVSLSIQVISPNCGPKVVHFDVTPSKPIYGALLFYRLRYKTSGDRTDWNNGVPMFPSEGNFIYDLSAASLTDFNQFKEPVAWVQFQLVALSADGTVIGRSDVFTDRLTISTICP